MTLTPKRQADKVAPSSPLDEGGVPAVPGPPAPLKHVVGIVFVGKESTSTGLGGPLYQGGCECGWTGKKLPRAKAQQEAYNHDWATKRGLE